MSFFDSDIVKNEMKEIEALQHKVYSNVWSFAQMDNANKRELDITYVFVRSHRQSIPACNDQSYSSTTAIAVITVS